MCSRPELHSKLCVNGFFSLCIFSHNRQAVRHEYTFHPVVTATPRYHISIIKSHLTRSIGTVTSEIHEEVLAAFDEYFPINADGGTFPSPIHCCRNKLNGNLENGSHSWSLESRQRLLAEQVIVSSSGFPFVRNE